MAAGGAVTRYFATLGFKVDKKELANIDRTLSNVEKKLRAFGKNIDKYLDLTLRIDKIDIDKTKLKVAVGDSLDKVSKTTSFELSNFIVDDRALRLALLRAMRRNRGVGGGPNPPLPTPTPPPNPNPAPRNRTPRPSGSGRSDLLHAGGAAGAFMRYGVSSLPLIGGVYGLSALNKMNQEVISAQLTTQAVTEAAGLTGQGPEAFDWLRGQANRIGFNYMDQVESYNNFLSNALGSGLSLQGSQDIYLGFAEYSRAMGISPARNKLVMNALSQMMGKGVVSMEELKKQMAESMPGTMDVFAQAYAQMTGSGLSGQEALAALYEAVPTGKVKSAELLPLVEKILRQRAAPKLDIAMKTSQAEQGRFQSMVADTATLASKAGVEEGFARIFKTLTTGLRESDGLIRKLSSSFNDMTFLFEDLILFPASFKRALEGRDSLVADWLGYEQVKEMKSDWAEIQAGLSEIMNLAEPPWALTLKDVAQELKDLIGVAGGISQRFREGSTASSIMMEDAFTKYGRNPIGYVAGGAEIAKYWGLSGLVAVGEGAGAAYGKVVDAIPFAKNHPAIQQSARFANYLSNNPYDPFADYMMKRESSLGVDTMQAYGNNPAAWRDMNRVSNQEAAYSILGKQGYGISQPVQKQEQNNTIYMEFKVEANDPAQIEDWFRTSFKKEISTAMPNFNYKE